MGLIANVTVHESLLIVGQFPEDLPSAGETWALTLLGETFHPAIYSCTCDSWCVFQNVLYGAGENGVYALDGTDGEDDSEEFHTAVLLAKSSFSTALPKSVRKVFVDATGDPSVVAVAGGFTVPAAAGVQAYGTHVFSRAALDVDWSIGVEGFEELRGIEIHAAVLPRRRG